jgi:hypothetical protein
MHLVPFLASVILARIQEPNASAARRARGAAKVVVDRFERDAYPRIVVLSKAVLVPGSPVASPDSASGSPSVSSKWTANAISQPLSTSSVSGAYRSARR